MVSTWTTEIICRSARGGACTLETNVTAPDLDERRHRTVRHHGLRHLAERHQQQLLHDRRRGRQQRHQHGLPRRLQRGHAHLHQPHLFCGYQHARLHALRGHHRAEWRIQPHCHHRQRSRLCFGQPHPRRIQHGQVDAAQLPRQHDDHRQHRLPELRLGHLLRRGRIVAGDQLRRAH